MKIKKLNEDLKIITDFSDYEPWSGAVSTYEKIESQDKLEELESILEELYPEGLTKTELNDLLWFDSETVYEWLNIDSEDEDDYTESAKITHRKMCSKKLKEERQPDQSVYNHPSDDDIEKILSTASYNGEDVTVDGVELTVISEGKDRYSFWTPDGFILYSEDEDKAKEALKNIKATIKENEDEEIRFAKKALPTLWKMYKNDEWTDVHEGEVYVDDFFSDYYKDVFGHRPRNASQIEREIKELSRELGVRLDGSKSCRGSKRLK